MQDMLISGAMLAVAALHLVPATAMWSTERVTALYGLPMDDPELAVLMRHRAAGFGIVAGLLLYGSVVPSAQSIALLAAALSMGSFVALAWPWAQRAPPLRRVVIADAVGLVVLAGAAVLRWL